MGWETLYCKRVAYLLQLTSRCANSKGVLVDGLDEVVGQVDRLQVSHPLKGEGLNRGDGVPGEVNVLQADREGLLSQGSIIIDDMIIHLVII